MYDDKYSSERLPGENMEHEKRGEYADLWEDADMMNEAPEFQGEDPYNPEMTEEEEDGRRMAQGGVETNGVEKTTEAKTKGKYGGAENLTSYGLDTAARIYGLNTVLKAVNETDETDRDVENPIGSIYERIAPNPEERAHLYEEIGKEDTDDKKEAREEAEPGDVNNAIRQMKILLNALESDPRFADVRERAAKEGQDVISYLTSGEVSPTLSKFFDSLENESAGNVEEILDEIIEEEKGKQVEEITEKVSEGQELSIEDEQKLAEAKEELDDEINPEMLR
jgi:hypothetical protein